uniref:RxLR effector protein n=1 Tax=Phytophthora sojae TaxID=67593 RepID=G1FRT4_PHYSO|nr:Avh172 [Phytophthora sojae]
MRLYVAALVAVATILASATAEVDSKTALAAEVPAAIRSLESDTPASRLLRTGTVTSADNEERGFLESVTRPVHNVLGHIKLKQLLKTTMNADDAFSFLKLDLIGPELLKKPNFKVWVNYVNKVEAKPQAVVLGKLKLHFGGEAKFAEMLQQATKVKSTRTAAEKLQKAQFAQWANEGWFATDIIKNVFKLDDATWSALPITNARRQVRKEYSAYLKANH